MNFEGFLKTEETNEFEKKPDNSRRNFLKVAMGAAFAGGVKLGHMDKVRMEKEKADLVEEDKKVTETEKVEEEVVEVAEVEEVQEEVQNDELPNEVNEGVDQRKEISFSEYKKIKPNLTFEQKVKEPVYENLNMPDKVGRYGAETHEGKILRSLRFKNITDAVEDRYNLPPGVLLAMVMEESTGEDLLPNARGDGGFGLSHMQGSTASEFGLKTFHGCNSLVCNSSRGCKNENGEFVNHAKQLADLMKQSADDRKVLCEADERLHWILNLDAVGRMLSSYMSGPKLKGKLSHLGSFRTAIARYAGSVNYENYWNDICRNMRDLSDSNVIDSIAENFDAINKDLRIDGEPANYYDYLQSFQSQAQNYGLEEYKKLVKYKPANSDRVLASYKEFVFE